MLSYMEYLGVPATVIICVVAVFLVIQIIGELLEFKGKIVPEFFKIRKYFARKKDEREKTHQMFGNINELKEDIKELRKESKSNDDYIRKLDKKIDKFDSDINKRVDKLDDEIVSMNIDRMRNEIIQFASDVHDKDVPVTRERFNRIFKTYDKYENLIKNTGRTNGEVDIAYRIINESYEERTCNHTFIEDIRGWK